MTGSLERAVLPIVPAEWLAANLRHDSVAVVDASWRMPGAGSAIDDYRRRHIPKAVFFDIDGVADTSSDLPHMLPSETAFAAWAGDNGISNDHTVIVYDDVGLFSAPRVWWTFRAMGHERTVVLDGGLPAWIHEGGEVTADIPSPPAATFKSKMEPRWLADADAVRDALAGGRPVIDARPAERFRGLEDEPRPGLRRGHMPGATNVPAGELLSGGLLRDIAQLEIAFATAGAATETPVITTCGSGVTAATLALALTAIGHENVAVYDGSWAEWGREGNRDREFPCVLDEVD